MAEPRKRQSRRPPEGVRSKLAADAAKDYELIRDAIKAGLEQTKTVWTEIQCKKCWKTCKYEVSVQDFSAVEKAARLWLNQGFGTPTAVVEGGSGFVLNRRVVMPAGSVPDSVVDDGSAEAA